MRASAAHARALHSRWLKFIACELRGRLGSKQCSPCSLLTAVGGRSSHWNLGPPRKCHGCAGPPKARAAPPLSRGQERRQILGRLRRPLRSRDRIACPAAQSARTLAGSRARAGELEGAASRSPGPAPAVAVRDLARPVVQSAATGGAPGVVVRGIGGVEAGSVVLALQPCHTPEERDQALVQQLKPTLSHESRARVMSERSAMAVQDRFEIPGMSRGQLSAPNLEEPACPGPARQGG